VKGAGIWFSASLVSLFWLSWKECTSCGMCWSSRSPLLPGGGEDICEVEMSRRYFPASGCQHGAQSSRHLQCSSPTPLPFSLHWLETLRISPNISLIQRGGKEMMKEMI